MPSDRPANGTRDDSVGLSIVVVAHNIPRELPRTLRSLSPQYQRHIDAADYEVLVIDNGSKPPVALPDPAGNVRVIVETPTSPSPAHAINRGLAEARGDVIGVMIDGARILSPGLLHFARVATTLYEYAVVASLGWYIGHDFERFARPAGFTAATEDALLESIDWPVEPDRLFEIATLDDSSTDGWFGPISESNCLFLSRASWTALGGVDERFVSRGGGLVNLDLLRRALALPGAELVILLGEGTFHQIHGGVSTGMAAEEFAAQWEAWAAEYQAIRGEAYATPIPARPPTYLGTLPNAVLARLSWAIRHPALNRPAPLGASFDFTTGAARPSAPASRPEIAAVLELARQQMTAEHFTGALAIARLAHRLAPAEPEANRITRLLAPWIPFGMPAMEHRVEYHLALGEAHRLLGDREPARTHFQTALTIDRDAVSAHVGLSLLNLPGPEYREWIERIYAQLEPEAILEIGTAQGHSLAAARAPTLAIAVDPVPSATVPLRADTCLVPEPSDVFFASDRLGGLLDGRRLDVVFIDGLHLFEQALRDFIHAEAYVTESSLIMIHDTLPLNEPTQSRNRDTQFHTGDVWKLVVCLRSLRPELEIETIATPWSGLTLVSGFGAGAVAFAGRYEEAVDRFRDLPFSALDESGWDALGIVENRWERVLPRLDALRGRRPGVDTRAG